MEGMNSKFKILTDPLLTDHALLNALLNLEDEIEETPGFWSAIANDKNFNDNHRRYAVFMLFKRHVKAGISINQLGELMNKPSWLSYEDVTLIEKIAGEMPIEFSLADSFFIIKVFSHLSYGRWEYWGIYFKIEGKINRRDFYNIISGENGQIDIKNKNRKLLAFALAPDNFLETNI
jgi:hypothetical protein